MNRLGAALTAGLLAIAWMPAAAFAQAGSTAQITGTVTDSSGGVLPGVDVTVTQTETGLMRSAVTGENGGYTLPNLPVGPYRLAANIQGFRSYVRTGIVLQVGGGPVIDILLELGDVAETVTVQADAPLVETRSTSVGQVIDSQQVLELPLNGRQVTDLMLLSPSVTVNTGGQFSTNRNYPTTPISVAGGSPGSTIYIMDGANHNDPGTGGNLPVPFPDALQEFRVETSAVPARFGNNASAVVNLVTKSGTNAVHGSVFHFLRNSALNARNAFALRDDGLKRNQFGGAAGGPIVRDRLFFFAGYQGTVIRTAPSDLRAVVPTADMLRGDFTTVASPACNGGRQITLRGPFVNNRIDPALFDRVATKYLEYIPVATDPCGEYRYGYPTPSSDHQLLTKVDYQMSQEHSLFVRHMDIRYELPYYFDGQNALTTPSVGRENQGRSFLVGSNYAFGRTLNSLRISTLHSRNDRSAAPFASPADFGANITTTERAGAFTNLSITNAFSMGGGGNNNAEYNYRTIQVVNDFDMLRGGHQITFGFDFMHQKMSVFNTQYSNGQMTFDGQITGLPLADFLVGRMSRFEQGADTLLRERRTVLGVYAQDAWRISPRVTLNAGLRFEPYFPLTNDDEQVLLFEPDRFAAGLKSRVYTNAPAGLIFPGDDGYPGKSMSNGDPWRFGPRVGVVYDPRGEGREVIRAAYGLMHDQEPMFHNIRVPSVPPWGSLITLNNVSMSDPWTSYPGGDPFPIAPSKDAPFPLFGTYWTRQRDVQTPSTQHWNVSLQRQLAENWAATVSYFGNKKDHLWGGEHINPAVFRTGATPGNTNQRRVLYLQNPQEGQYFSSVVQLNMEGKGSYNAMLLSVQKRFSDGYSVMANHTWSRCVTDAESHQFLDPFYLVPGNPQADRGPCNSDLRHVFNASAVINPPTVGSGVIAALTDGWQLAAIFQARTGAPLNVTFGQDVALSGTGGYANGQRPDLVGDWKLANPTNQRWFDTDAFQRPAAGTYGNLGRNALRGPGMWKIDAVLTRRFEVANDQRFEFRVEAFNLLNRVGPGVVQAVNGFVPAGNPNTVFGSLLFGRITSAADPRILQFALKYVF